MRPLRCQQPYSHLPSTAALTQRNSRCVEVRISDTIIPLVYGVRHRQLPQDLRSHSERKVKGSGASLTMAFPQTGQVKGS